MAYRRRTQRKRRRPLLLDILGTLIFFGMIVAAITWLNSYNPQNFAGNAWVVDGDTIVMDGEKLRLSGIDAPELSQQCERSGGSWACGVASRNALRKMLKGQNLRCASGGFDRYDRSLVVCHAGKTDVNATLVSTGWAVDYGGYGREEKVARKARVGIWQGTFENPQEWRHANRGDASGIPHGVMGWQYSSMQWLKSWF